MTEKVLKFYVHGRMNFDKVSSGYEKSENFNNKKENTLSERINITEDQMNRTIN